MIKETINHPCEESEILRRSTLPNFKPIPPDQLKWVFNKYIIIHWSNWLKQYLNDWEKNIINFGRSPCQYIMVKLSVNYKIRYYELCQINKPWFCESSDQCDYFIQFCKTWFTSHKSSLWLIINKWYFFLIKPFVYDQLINGTMLIWKR